MTSALILVDIQNDFCKGGALAVPDGDAVVSVANALQPHFEYVVASQDWHPRAHLSFLDSPHRSTDVAQWPPHCVQYSSGAELHPSLNTHLIDLRVKKGRSIQHENFSGFSHEPNQVSCDLEQHLKQQKITDLYIMGLATEFCVLQTVLDALKAGFTVTVIEDGIRGIGDMEQQAVAKETMRKNGAKFMAAEECIQCC